MQNPEVLSRSAATFDPSDPLESPVTVSTAKVISLLDRLPAGAASRPANAGRDLVESVADRIGVMAGRTRELESYVQQFEEWSSAQVSAVEMVAEHWKSVTATAEMRIDELQRSLEASKRRAELAECDLQNVRYRLEMLHDRIAKVFGSTARFRATRETTDAF